MSLQAFRAASAGLLALTLAATAGTAQAVTQTSAPVVASASFQDLTLDTFLLTGPLNTITGHFEWGTGTISLSFGPVTFNTVLASGTVDRTTLGTWTDLDSGAGYRFDGIGPGNYALKVSGQVPGIGALRAVSEVSAVPEPPTLALLAAGLGLLATQSRRRREVLDQAGN